MSLTDEARKIREGEELPLDRLETYLKTAFPGRTGTLDVKQFPSGFSNLTYLVTWGASEMVLRRPPFGNRVKTGHDMGREVRVLGRLSTAYPLAPKPLAFCEDEEFTRAEDGHQHRDAPDVHGREQ